MVSLEKVIQIQFKSKMASNSIFPFSIIKIPLVVRKLSGKSMQRLTGHLKKIFISESSCVLNGAVNIEKIKKSCRDKRFHY